MSQPPSPYSRSYSFTAWKVSNPNDPLPGNNVDQQLDNIGTSLNATISRLSEIQADDGKVRSSALPNSLSNVPALADAAVAAATSATTSAASAAVSATSAAASATSASTTANDFLNNNLASLPSKSEARANLQLSQYYPELAGDNLFIEPQTVDNTYRYFPAGVEQPAQHRLGITHSFTGPLSTSSYASRKFRSSILFGTLQDTATKWSGVSAGQPSMPDITYRVDNVSFALMYGGMYPPNYEWNSASSDGSRGRYNPIVSNNNGTVASFEYPLLAKYDYSKLDNLPSIGNPFATLRQLGDAISTHGTFYDHLNIPTTAQKTFLNNLLLNNGYGNVAVINNASGYSSGNFNSTYYPKEIKMVLNGVTYAIPARIVT